MVNSLFISAKTWKKPRCPSAGEWGNKNENNKKKKNPWKDIEETWIHITRWKKQIWIGCIPSDSNYMTLWKKENKKDITKINAY